MKRSRKDNGWIESRQMRRLADNRRPTEDPAAPFMAERTVAYNEQAFLKTIIRLPGAALTAHSFVLEIALVPYGLSSPSTRARLIKKYSSRMIKLSPKIAARPSNPPVINIPSLIQINRQNVGPADRPRERLARGFVAHVRANIEALRRIARIGVSDFHRHQVRVPKKPARRRRDARLCIDLPVGVSHGERKRGTARRRFLGACVVSTLVDHSVEETGRELGVGRVGELDREGGGEGSVDRLAWPDADFDAPFVVAEEFGGRCRGLETK